MAIKVLNSKPKPETVILITIFPILVLFYVVEKLFTGRSLGRFYVSRPYPGKQQQQWFSWFHAMLGSVFGAADQIQEGYAKYGKKNIPFIVPNIRKGPVLVIPPAQLKTVLSNTESKLAAHSAQAEAISSKYTIRDPEVQPTNYHVGVLRKTITKRLGEVAEDLADEVSLAFDAVWGTSETWKTIVAIASFEEIIARAVNRVAIGPELCRNDEFLKPLVSYSMSVLRDGLAISILPNFLQPVLGPLITWKGKKECEASIRVLIPFVKQRLEQVERYQNGLSDGWTPPNDILQWAIEQSPTNKDPKQMTPRLIAHRLVLFSFSMIDATSIALFHVLTDLYSTPPSECFVDTLREECNTVLKETSEGHWTKDAVSRLTFLDSTIRESMRLSDFGWTAFDRKVTSPTGIPMSPGLTVPKGVQIQVPLHCIHMDPDFHPNPTQFDPFRFTASPTNPSPEYARSLVTLDNSFLGFGFRQNACPGRYIATHLMKIIMVNVVQKYDVDVTSETPKSFNLMEFRIPREDLTVRVKRRG